MYRHIFFDLDDTLLDFHKAEAIAIGRTFRDFGLPDTDDAIRHYSRVNQRQWELLNRGKLTREQVLITRFQILFQEMGLSADAEAVRDRYEGYLSQGHYFIPGAPEVLHALAPKYRLYIASNGTASVQYSRLNSAGILPLFQGVFISQELGANKPSQAFFERAFSKIPGFQPSEALLVGDSLSSDILGARNAGIGACWFNPRGLAQDPKLLPDFEIRGLPELLSIL